MSDSKSDTVVNALQSFLQQGGDVTQLKKIAEQVNELVTKEKKENIAVIETMVTPSTTQIKELEAMLNKISGKELDFEYVINEEMIGGLKVKINDYVIDMSLKSALIDIKESLKG